MSKAWNEASAAVPLGWKLDSQHCAWAGLSPGARLEEWWRLRSGPLPNKRPREPVIR
jgi:hypothetical protein